VYCLADMEDLRAELWYLGSALSSGTYSQFWI